MPTSSLLLRRLGFPAALAGLFLTALAAPFASAAVVDIDLRYATAEPTGCRVWTGTGTVSWNLTLAMNGTDATLTTTPTYVIVDNSTIPVADGWGFLLVGTNQGTTPPAFDDATSNTFAAGDSVYAVGAGALDLALYSASYGPPAQPAKLALILTPSPSSDGGTYTFNLAAITHRSGLVPQVQRELSLCVQLPAYPDFEVGAVSGTLDAPADSNVTLSYWLRNTGNNVDTYACAAITTNSSFAWRFVTAMNPGNTTNAVAVGANTTVRIEVMVPPTATAGANVSVALNCTSQTDTGLSRETNATRIRVPQFFWICGEPAIGIFRPAVRPGETATFEVKVENRGNGADTATLAVASGNLSWDPLLSPDTLELDAGAFGYANFSVTVPLGVPMFTYDYFVNITSVVVGTPVCALRIEVRVLQVYTPVVSQPPSQSALPGGEVVFDFLLKNGGNGLDSLLIDAVNLTGWRLFLSPPIGEKLLQAGEEASFQATVVVPADARAGTYSQVVRITSKYAQLDQGVDVFVKSNLTVVVGETCGVSLSSSSALWVIDPLTVANGTVRWAIPVTLTNEGNALATFTVSVEATEAVAAAVAQGPYSLEGFLAVDVGLEVFVTDSVAAGTYHVAVGVVGACFGDSAAEITLNVDVIRAAPALNNTFVVQVRSGTNGTVRTSENQSGAVLGALEGDQVTFEFRIENTGTGPLPAGTVVVELYDDLECPAGQANLSCGLHAIHQIELTAALAPGESRTIVVTYKVPAVDRFGGSTAVAASNNHRLQFTLPAVPGATLEQVVEVHLQATAAPVSPPSDGNNTSGGLGGGVSVLLMAAIAGAVGAIAGGYIMVKRRRQP